jgi:hypothetical protein
MVPRQSNYPYIIAIEVIRSPLPKSNYIRAQAGLVERFLFDLSDDLAPRGKGLSGIRRLRHHGIDARRDVFDRLQHIELKVEAFDFLGQFARTETIAMKISRPHLNNYNGLDRR